MTQYSLHLLARHPRQLLLASACSGGEPNSIERLVEWLGQRWPLLFLATGSATARNW